MLVRYQGRVVGFVGATRYELVPEFECRPSTDIHWRRLVAVCEWALEARRVTGSEPGRLPQDRGRG
jgi:hypothetical protein